MKTLKTIIAHIQKKQRSLAWQRSGSNVHK